MEDLGVGALSRAWRILYSGPGTGPENMALDEALAQSVRDGGPPFLRFYTWKPATLSLGRFQHPDDGLGPGACDVPRVRRSTGGGAIWHDEELTYSLGCTQDDLGLKGVKASFEKLAGFLLDTWRDLGWEATFARDAKAEGTWGAYTPACFAGTEEYDILVDGRKLGGNAQRRDRTTIFQHGSIPLSLDHQKLAGLFLPDYRPLPNSVTDLDSCGWTGSTDDLTSRLTRAFLRRMGAPGMEAHPRPEETARAAFLGSTKYGASSWNEHGGGSLRSPLSSSDGKSSTEPQPPRQRG